MKNCLRNVLTAAALCTAAGFPCVAFGQTNPANQPASQPATQRGSLPGMPPRVVAPDERLTRATDDNTWANADFRGWKFFDGAKIVNSAGDKVGDIKDLVIDRGSGRVLYAIVRTDSTFGMGGKTVAVPMNSFGWDAQKEHMSVKTSAEDLKAYAEFSDADWTSLSDAKAARNTPFRERMNKDITREERRWDTNLKPESLDGKVTSVERVEMVDGEEMTVVTIEGASGPRRVALGPSWFVGSSGVQPSRGDSMSVSWVPARDANMYDADATEWRREKNTVSSYSADGMPMWNQPAYTADNREMGMDSRRLVRASDLKGAKVLFRGAAAGKISDVIFDRSAGRVAFLSIDPNENFLGMGDTKRLVPWNVSGISSSGEVMVDADKSMILAAGETPSDLNDLRTGSADRTYKAYDVQAPRYRSTPGMGTPNRPGEPYSRNNDIDNTRADNRANMRHEIRPVDWATHQAIMGAVNYDTARKITGRVTSIDEMDLGKVGRCFVATIDTDTGTEKVILSPAANRTRDEFGFATTDLVRFGVVKADFAGTQPMWLATSVTTSGRDEATLFPMDGAKKMPNDKKKW